MAGGPHRSLGLAPRPTPETHRALTSCLPPTLPTASPSQPWRAAGRAGATTWDSQLRTRGPLPSRVEPRHQGARAEGGQSPQPHTQGLRPSLQEHPGPRGLAVEMVQGPPRTWALTGTRCTVRGRAWRAAPGLRRAPERRPSAVALEGVGGRRPWSGSGCSVQLWLRDDPIGDGVHRAKNVPAAQRAPHECWGPAPAHQVQGPRTPSTPFLKQAT